MNILNVVAVENVPIVQRVVHVLILQIVAVNMLT
jgi:hypothetical protein